MYGVLWRVLPGPFVVRLLMLLLLAFAAVAACFVWLFPTVAPYLPFNEITVEDSAP